MHEFIWSAIDLGIPYIITLTDFFLLCPKVNLTPDKFSLCSGPKLGKACAELCPELNQKFILYRLTKSKEILENAKKVISPSNFVADIFQNEYPNISIHIIPHGLSSTHIKQNNNYIDYDDKIVFGYAGSLIYHKGVHILVKAFTKIQSNNVRLVIHGSGQEDYMELLNEILDEDKRVTYYGKYTSNDLGKIFGNMDVLVAPSICYENYPFVVHEALASNVPVIAPNLGGMAEKIKDNFNGFTFSPGDASDLAQKMEGIIKNPVILYDLKQNIKNQIIVPTIEQEAYAYFKIFKDI
jgi:glycosyltransferase involved in cell wall biosynthesis